MSAALPLRLLGSKAFIVFLVFAAVTAIVLILSIKKVPEDTLYIVRRQHANDQVWGTGYHFLVPFAGEITQKLTTKEQQRTCQAHFAKTKDDKTVETELRLTYRITEAFNHEVEHPDAALEQLAYSTLDTIIGAMPYDEAVQSVRTISGRLTAALSEAADRWHITVQDAEITNFRRT